MGTPAFGGLSVPLGVAASVLNSGIWGPLLAGVWGSSNGGLPGASLGTEKTLRVWGLHTHDSPEFLPLGLPWVIGLPSSPATWVLPSFGAGAEIAAARGLHFDSKGFRGLGWGWVTLPPLLRSGGFSGLCGRAGVSLGWGLQVLECSADT